MLGRGFMLADGGSYLVGVTDTYQTSIGPSASASMVFPAGSQVGDFCIIGLNSDTNLSDSNTPPPGWTRLDLNNSSSGAHPLIIWKALTSADLAAGSVQFALGDAVHTWTLAAWCAAFRTANSFSTVTAKQRFNNSGTATSSFSFTGFTRAATSQLIIVAGALFGGASRIAPPTLSPAPMSNAGPAGLYGGFCAYIPADLYADGAAITATLSSSMYGVADLIEVA